MINVCINNMGWKMWRTSEDQTVTLPIDFIENVFKKNYTEQQQFFFKVLTVNSHKMAFTAICQSLRRPDSTGQNHPDIQRPHVAERETFIFKNFLHGSIFKILRFTILSTDLSFSKNKPPPPTRFLIPFIQLRGKLRNKSDLRQQRINTLFDHATKYFKEF